MPTLVVASANGGATWQTGRVSTIGDPFTQVLYAVAFADARQGWVVGKSGLILPTSDGGSHWAVSHRDVPDVCLRGVAAIGRHTAVAVGYARSTALGLIVVPPLTAGRPGRRVTPVLTCCVPSPSPTRATAGPWAAKASS